MHSSLPEFRLNEVAYLSLMSDRTVQNQRMKGGHFQPYGTTHTRRSVRAIFNYMYYNSFWCHLALVFYEVMKGTYALTCVKNGRSWRGKCTPSPPIQPHKIILMSEVSNKNKLCAMWRTMTQ